MRREPVEGPDVIAYELGHTLFRRRKKDAGASLEDRWARFERLLKAVDLVAPDPQLLRETARIVDRSGVSFYDASFLAFAALRRVSLCTADSGLASHADALAIPCYLLPRDFEVFERAFPVADAADT